MKSALFWRLALLLLPATLAVRLFAPQLDVLCFSLAALSLIPLARAMGVATETLAERMGPAPGSLLNATFGNAAELIVGIVALAHGHVELVKGSLTGSILGNLLLVAGAAIVAGGLRTRRLRFNRLAAGASVTTLFLSVVSMAAPAMLASMGHAPAVQMERLSVGISVVLLIMYGLSLLFVLHTHKGALGAHPENPATPAEAAAQGALDSQARNARTARKLEMPVGRAFATLAAAAVATGFCSEVLVSALTGTLAALDLPETFVGVVIVAIVGNAAEHSSAVLFGRRGDLDVALGIPWESSKQIALFVAPVLVIVGAAMGVPMNLAFTPFEVASVGLAVISTALFALDGETHWLDGAFLIAVYAVLALGFFYLR